MNNTNYEGSEYRGARIRTYSYEDGRQYGVDVYFGEHEFHKDGFPTRTHALMHGCSYVDNLPDEARQTWNQEVMAKHAATAYAGL